MQLYKNVSDLTPEIMAKAWNILSGGFYNIEMLSREEANIEKLITLHYEKDQYLGHIRVKNPDDPNAVIHSVMITRVEYEYDARGQISGIAGIHVANPAAGNNTFNGRTFYTTDAIIRLDIFKVTPTKLYQSYSQYPYR
jgi:hypothetical protein